MSSRVPRAAYLGAVVALAVASGAPRAFAGPTSTDRATHANLPAVGSGVYHGARKAGVTAASVQIGTDPAGDATRSLDGVNASCGDLRSSSIDFSAGAITAHASMATNCDPATDGGWVHGATQLVWLIDTNNDQFIDDALRYYTDGRVTAEVVKISTGERLCSAATSFAPDAGYTASFDPSCIGAPRSFRYATEMRYDSDLAHSPSSDVVTLDLAPDDNLYAGPITRRGYFMFGQDGHSYHFGADAKDHGGLTTRPNLPVVGAALSPSGSGYWEVATDGGIFAFGDASFFGSTGAIHLNRPIVGMASTPSGKGYWLVASDGGIFAYGDAVFYGSTGAMHLNQPIVGMASTPSGKGYWFVASDGGIFAYGDAAFYGSTGAIHLNKPIVGMASSPSGKGYWFVASDGGVFNYGDAAFDGTPGAIMLFSQPIVAIGAL